jgi:hypothetical protein
MLVLSWLGSFNLLTLLTNQRLLTFHKFIKLHIVYILRLV